MIMGSLIRKRIMAYYTSLYNWFPYNPKKNSAAKTSAPGINWALRTQPSNIVHCCLRPNHGRRLFGGLSHAGKNPGPTQGRCGHLNLGVLDSNKKTDLLRGFNFLIHAGSMLWFLLFWKEKKLELVSLEMESFERCETMGVSLHQCCIKSMLCYWISAHLHTQHSSPPANQIDYTIIVQ